jgi:Tol biopolymer transport system component/DNA-binding winged helix-turn-helix (wHTH) protein
MTRTSRIVRFGVFDFNVETGELSKTGRQIRLQEQQRQVLRILLAHPGELVTREALRLALWPDDTFVDFDAGVNVVVNKIRQVLGDSASSPRFIETLPRRGYRFIAPAAPVVEGNDVPGPQTEVASSHRLHAGDPMLAAAQTGRRLRIGRIGLPVSLGVVVIAGTLAGAYLLRTHGAGRSASQTTQPQSVQTSDDSPRPGNYPYTRLTFGPGLQTDPVFSPDGKFIAFASDRAGNLDIWVQPVSGASDPVQVTKSPASDTQPAWSPDGTTLVFRSERGHGGLFLVPAFGGAERQLTSFGSDPTWSADGAEILFFAGRQAMYRMPRNYLRLYTVSLDGEPPREILKEFLRDGFWVWAASHPSGAMSVAGVHRTRGLGFFTVSRNEDRVIASKRVPLGADPGAIPFRFQWDSAGTFLYVEAAVKETRSLWRVKVDPATLDWLSAERLTTPAGRDMAPTLSRDATRLVFSQQNEASRLLALPLDMTTAGPRVVGAGRLLTEEGAVASMPSMSPDGSKLAYVLRRPGTDRSELWVMNIDGRARELLATNAAGAIWSRDGTRVAYTYVRGERPRLEAAVAYRQLGGTERFLTPWSAGFYFVPTDWTPDGTAVLGLFLSAAPGTPPTSVALWSTSTPNAKQPERVLLSSPPNAQIWCAAFSPDARWILFTVLREVQNAGLSLELAVARPGTPPEQWVRIAPRHEWPDKPRWGADGKTIFFISTGSTPRLNLWSARFDPQSGRPIGEPQSLTHFDSAKMAISPYIDDSYLGVSPRHAVLQMTSVTGSIWMLENVDR